MKNALIRISLIVLLIMGDLAILSYVKTNIDRLPFSIPRIFRSKISTLLPTPTPTAVPMEKFVEFSQGQWIGSIVYGKITNHSTQTLVNPELFFALSSTKDESTYLDSFLATISALIKPEESIYFSQRFQTPATESFWWSASVAHVATYSGQLPLKLPKGQQVSSKPINPPIAPALPKATTDPGPWGVAKQINDVTWTIKLGTDDRMATPQETLQALNHYREAHGSPPLTWDDNLAGFAHTRATYLNSIQSTDEHKGFKEYVGNEDNVKKLGFWALGENSGYGSKLIGVHLIEWVYAADPAHNANQLDKQWSHVGIGIEGLGVVFIFGGSKI